LIPGWLAPAAFAHEQPAALAFAAAVAVVGMLAIHLLLVVALIQREKPMPGQGQMEQVAPPLEAQRYSAGPCSCCLVVET
tara:strand:+ start:329 stop:568 length:240 start_codon:yes stop_codon:yes gene_type:complete